MATHHCTLRQLTFLKSKVEQQCCLDSEEALAKGSWVKLICGASNEDLPAISDLCALYATAGVHCIDVAADAAVVYAARKGLDWCEEFQGSRPWLMISLSDGKDEHFRKAWFDHNLCPPDCPKPCQKSCPASAITNRKGINTKRCYGCGRCLPSCPLGLIQAQDKHLELEEIAPLIAELQPDAVEIHTAPGRKKEFQKTIKEIISSNVQLKRVAVSCGLEGHQISPTELAQELWERFSYLRKHELRPLWQLDGRRMSGDLGIGTAKVAVNLWQKILAVAPPGPLQLAGGTNAQTIQLLPNENGPAGIAFGGIARKLIEPWLLKAEANERNLRDWPEGWQPALQEAKQLINPWLLKNSRPKVC